MVDSRLRLAAPGAAPELGAGEIVDDVTAAELDELLPPLPEAVERELPRRAELWLAGLDAVPRRSPGYAARIRQIEQVGRQALGGTAEALGRFLQARRKRGQGLPGGGTTAIADRLGELARLLDTLGATGARAPRERRKREAALVRVDELLVLLERDQDGLRRDNAVLSVERRALWDGLVELETHERLLAELDRVVSERIAVLERAGDPDAAVLDGEVRFVVRGRRAELRTQLAVGAQSYLAMDVVRAGNTALLDGVERARTSALAAARTAAVVTGALGERDGDTARALAEAGRIVSGVRQGADEADGGLAATLERLGARAGAGASASSAVGGGAVSRSRRR